MRAAVFEEFGKSLTLANVADPTPGPGELVLRVRSAGVCGTDLHLSEHPPGAPPGTVFGHEFAGEVVAIGAGVRGWRCGDRACALPYIGCAACPACLAGDGMACAQLRGIGIGHLPGAYAEFIRVAGPQMITDRVGMDTFSSAFEALRRPTTQCKVILRP